MGIIRRQSIRASFLLYLGAAIGFFTKVLVFPNFLSSAEVGLSNLLVTNAMLLAQFAAVGFSNITLRFFPYFQDKSRRHHDFLSVLLTVPAVGFLVVMLLVVIFQQPLMEHFQQNSPLVVEYFWYLMPLTLATLYFDLLDAYLRSLQKTVVPVLFREVIQRLLVLLCIFLYAVGWLDFQQFVTLYVGLLSSITVMMVVYIAWLGHFRLRMRRSWRMRKLLRRIIVFGGFTLLGNIAVNTIYTIDGLMLAAYTGMDAVGIYTTCFYVTALMLLPWRAIQKVAAAQVAELLRTGDMVGMNRLYKRISQINTAIGCFLLGALVIGSDTLFTFLPAEYSAGHDVILILGLARLIDLVTGLNGYIMVVSRYFKLDLIMNIALVVLTIGLNAWLIPKMGITGAAWATSVAMNVSNLCRMLFLWWKMGLLPLTVEMLALGLLGGVAFLAQWAIPDLGNVFLNFGVRFTVFSVLFAIPTVHWGLVPDANRLYEMVLRKVRLRH